MNLKYNFKGILTPLFSYKEMSLNHESVSNPPKKVDEYRHAIFVFWLIYSSEHINMQSRNLFITKHL